MSVRFWFLLVLALGTGFVACDTPDPDLPLTDYDWASYLGDDARSHYAPLEQINKTNVAQLEPVWTYRTGDLWDTLRAQIQTNPLIIDGVLYGTSPRISVFALDATTGEERWRFDPTQVAGERGFMELALGVSRGVSYWTDGNEARILFSAGTHLFALDAETGQLKADFGDGGIVDLRQGLGRDVSDLFIASTTPGTLYKDLIIMGTRVSEGMDAAPGHIRAYNVQTGEIAWIFHTIPHPGEYGYDTWPEDAWQTLGGANSWAGMSVDAERGIVFIPTGSASFDFWGGNRPGDNLFATSVLALDAGTGERIWHYQTVRHDIWDRDLPAPPNLVTVTHDGEHIDAVAQVTKHGYVFLFDRETGAPLFPIEERPFPASTLQDEIAAPTQPIPTKPAPFAPHSFTEADVTDRTPEARAFVLDSLRTLSPTGTYVPFDTRGMVLRPGFDGGAEWGGAATDPDGILYVNANHIPWVVQMHEVATTPDVPPTATLGERTYAVYCAACHGPERAGNPQQNSPSLLGLGDRFSEEQMRQVIRQGRNFMPSFPHLSDTEMDAVVAFLLEQEEPDVAPDEDMKEALAQDAPAVPYRFGGYHRFFDPEGFPASRMPWGSLHAIDLNTGEYRWSIPLGEDPRLKAQGIENSGTENYGGPVVTAGGVLFIAATNDEMFRAFDKDTGDLLWETKLPAGGYATPSTYMVDGKQYVVIASGGGKMGTPSGDTYTAFALPDGE